MCFGPFRAACHWGPLTALGIIKIVTFATVFCNNQWWPAASSALALTNSILFYTLSGLTLYHFLNALSIGPGHLPLNWRPVDRKDEEFLQFCSVCRGYKAPRSHHCKKCGRCVMKMDHHCPWINNCVGHKNHYNFTLFLLFAVCGCFQASIILSCSLWSAIYKIVYLVYGPGSERMVTLGLGMLFVTVLALGFAIGVVIAVGMLLYFQMRTILRNRTAIEDWIVTKAEVRRYLAKKEGLEIEPFVFPYDLGYMENFKQVFSSSYAHDGISWKVVSGCDQYTLTREQLLQKVEKKQRSRPFSVVKNYSGYRFPVVHGFKVIFNQPCNDEPRVPLVKGETVTVTRYTRHWVFGELQSTKQRGWFPRCCVVAIEDLEEKEEEDKKVD